MVLDDDDDDDDDDCLLSHSVFFPEMTGYFMIFRDILLVDVFDMACLGPRFSPVWLLV